MFGINKSDLIQNLEKLRKSLCCYSGVKMCDCKFDPTSTRDRSFKN